MIKYFASFLLCLNTLFAFSQTDEDYHQMFLEVLKKEKIDSLYNYYLTIEKSDANYKKALKYRNEYGWALNEVEQLKKDIPALIELTEDTRELFYFKIFEPQNFPPSEWSNFSEIANVLEKYFDNTTLAYREVLSIKLFLNFLTKNNEDYLTDHNKLVPLLDKDTESYFHLLLTHGKIMIDLDKGEEGIKSLVEGYAQTNKSEFLFGMIYYFAKKKDFTRIIQYESEIIKESSGALLFILGEASLENGDAEIAGKHFDQYISRLTFTDYYPYAEVIHGNTVYDASPHTMEILGDFYHKTSESNSCKYYSIAVKLLDSEIDDKYFEKQLIAVKDPEKKSEMISDFEKHKKEQQKGLKRIEKKMKACL